MVNIVEKLVPESKYSIKCPYKMTPTRIVVHNTYNDASARNEIAYMTKNDKTTSFHYAVDDKEIVQGLLLDRNGWHASDGRNGKGNREGIAIEICYSKSGGDRFIKAEQNAVDLIVYLLKKYNWGIDKVTKHQDYTNKYCPHRTLDMGWNRFLKMIEDKLNADKVEKYTLIVDVPAYISSQDAINGTNKVKDYAKGEYYVYKKSNGMINITKKQGTAGAWINPKDNVIKTTYKTVSNCSWLNLRTSPNYGNNIYKAVKKGTRVEYLGTTNGWAKVKYEGKTLYCGENYLK